MKVYFVLIDPEEDCDFLNACTIKHEITPKSEFGHWFDYPTNAIILSKGDMFTFTIENPEDELILKLKFGNRISEEHINNVCPAKNHSSLKA